MDVKSSLRSFYFPILRAKRGEIQALGGLGPIAKDRTRPLIDIPRQKESDNRTLPEYLRATLSKLPSTWGTGRPLYFDMSLFAASARTDTNVHPIELVFEYANQARLLGMPATGTLLFRGPETDYLDAVAKIAKRDNRGIALRFDYSDIVATEGLRAAVELTRQVVGVEATLCDVFLDTEAIDRLPPGSRGHETLLPIIQLAIEQLADVPYRSVVVCGSSIPENVGKKYNTEPCRVERTEFRLWKSLLGNKNMRRPLFGDYGVIYPFQSTDNAPVRPPSRIRLSTPTEHVLYRSTPDGYRKLRDRVTLESPAISQVDSVGKRAIFGRGHGFTGVGGAADWVARDMNAHIESTVNEIAKERLRRRIPRRPEHSKAKVGPWLQEGLELPATDPIERR